MSSESKSLDCEARPNNVSIRVSNLSKVYQVYERPEDRLKEWVLPKIRRWMGLGTKQYHDEFWALKDISFEVKKGETLGIIGRNGAGKSTLLQIICGTLHPSGGEVEINGRVAALLELGSGFNPDFTGRENIYMNASILGLTRNEIDDRYDKIVAFADIGEFINQPIKTYSSGMVVRLAFSVIAHVDAEILVIDEALAVGDAFFTQKCMRFLRDFMLKGTVIFVSHDTGAAVNLCNRAIYLSQGTVKLEGEPNDVVESYLEALYESQQGESAKTDSGVEAYEKSTSAKKKDMRRDFINTTTLRNDIELFPYSPDNSSFGKGGAKIVDVQVFNVQGDVLSWVVGGENIELVIKCQAKYSLISPIVGFHVKDRLGQVLFGDNTYITYINNSVSFKENSFFNAAFTFEMPIMPEGDYTIGVAIAEGTQEEHIQHHWIHDAFCFKVRTSSVCFGIFSPPIHHIEFR